MTVNEYNHVWYPLYMNTNAFISRLDDALEKAGLEAVSQAKCLGWTPDMQTYLLHAVEFYQAAIRAKLDKLAVTEILANPAGPAMEANISGDTTIQRDGKGAVSFVREELDLSYFEKKEPEKKICNTNKPAKRAKYMPRINAYRGENRIKQNWLTENFGDRFVLVWTGHSHFAKDTETGERFYIFKKEKFLLAESLYCNYYFWKKWKKQGMEQLCTSSKYSHEFNKLGTKILVLGNDMQIQKGE